MMFLCACNGIEDNEKQQNAALRLDYEALVSAAADGACVADISAIERDDKASGYVLSFSDGGGLTLSDLQEGGRELKSFTEDALGYCFEFEGGEKVTLPKAQPAEPFCVEISGDEVEITDGGSLTASYKVSGAGNGLEVTAMAGEGWKAEITEPSASEGTVKVTAPNPITSDKVLLSFKDASGRQVVRALRLTTKSAVKRGSILTFANMGVRYYTIDPAVYPYSVALERYQKVPEGGVQIMTCAQYDGADPDALHYQLDLAAEVGVKLVVSVEQYSSDMIRYVVNDIKDHPALWGYTVGDEPHADLFEYLGERMAIVHETDPAHPCHLNLNGTGGTFGPGGSYHTDTYDEYLERFVNEVHPDFLSFDVYPCITDYVIQKDWYSSLEQIAAKAKKYNMDFWTYTSVCVFTDGNGTQAAPSVATIRLQDYTSLAYGSRALEYFTWAGDDGNMAVCNLAGDISTTNPTFDCLKTVNEEVQNRAFVFDGCNVNWAGLYGAVPDGCQAVDESKIPEEIIDITTADSFMMSSIDNDGGMSGYFCIVSRTHLKESNIRLRFRYPVQTVERDGSLKVYNPGDHDFTVDPGDILIIKTK